MKFIIKELVLWLKNGNKRTIKFEANKVNVITGDSGTGKSVILEIIDYCFFGSKSRIPDEKINDNILWYGIKFEVNDKVFTIARGALNINRYASKQYYFSAVGDVPDILRMNIGENELKSIIEREFSIDSNVVVPYGGKKIKSGSKISLRYFFLFNTQSGDTIDHTEVFFDKSNDVKYVEALHRVFDLATGIDNVKNILIKEKIENLEKELVRFEKKKLALQNRFNIYEKEMRNLIKKAKEFELIPIEINNFESDILNLEKIIIEIKDLKSSENLKTFNTLQDEKRTIQRELRNLEKFKDQYKKYEELEKENLESLKPVEFIKSNYSLIIKHPEIEDIINILNNEMRDIKKEITAKKPFDINVEDEIKELKIKLKGVMSKLEDYPLHEENFATEIQKYIFMGEIKTKLEFYRNVDSPDFEEEKIQQTQIELKSLKEKLGKQSLEKELVINLLEEFIGNYLRESGEVFGIYQDYLPVFNYKEKNLHLKKPGALVSSIVGSSSNHMFMHLCFMLGLHELIIFNKAPFVPSLLILDQPSRPYYGDKEKKQENTKDWMEIPADDKSKITTAFKLLNTFISKMNINYEADFQIIVLEHIPSTIWTEAGLENVVLVDREFENGNALIPEWLI
ncbi:DUF3732 domain-containing protein [Paenibacillus hunanensis]|uniref:DUF3732 domain-containing protein n=1 Tax=Paenibacillus hunanensis TaxID=539262 RepID=A0ABU1IUR0_9BACL|nr:DUF3732 domain-containing protein [Paenibacillus hunanensis]MDR6242961.1 hypothetical protein [Paenibacillus hunanensis]GGJ13055.1 hypothetical protein GCM10008022_22690 [Paenibacillus hunanensis]